MNTYVSTPNTIQEMEMLHKVEFMYTKYASLSVWNVTEHDVVLEVEVVHVTAGQLSATEPWSSTLVLTTCEAFRPPHVGHHEGSLLIRSW